MLTVANTNLTNTFDYWRSRTNELASAMTTCVVTTDANTGSSFATGNAGITGTFSANNLVANVITATSLSINSISVGNSTVSPTGLTIGNSVVNTSITPTQISISNTTANIVLTVPNTSIAANGQYFHNANGSWVPISLPYITIGTMNTSGTSPQLVDYFDATQYRSGEYQVSVHDNVSNNDHAAKILILGIGSQAYVTEYAQITTNSSVGVFSATCNGTATSLYFTPVSTTTTVRFVRTTA